MGRRCDAVDAERGGSRFVSPQAGVLNEDYYPGDVGFDPLGLKPTDPAEFAEMQTKELQNGRLAMLAVLGFLVAESWHPLFADVTGPAIDHLTQVRQEYPAFFEIGALVIGGLEVNRALVGWAFPDSREKVRAPRPLPI